MTLPKPPSQRERILAELKNGRRLNRQYCMSQMCIFEAPARISELRT